MARKSDFISDNLINMRERLKQNYEEIQRRQAAAVPADKKTPENVEKVPSEEQNFPASGFAVQQEEAAVQPQTKEIASVQTYLPQIHKNSIKDDPSGREKRELEGRVIRDLSCAETEMQILETRLEELKKFHNVLKKQYDSLTAMPEPVPQDQLYSLQTEYFSASGRWQAFDAAKHSLAGTEKNDSGENSRIQQFLVAGAILAGSIIIALVLVGLFG